jgi:hypothetical protein
MRRTNYNAGTLKVVCVGLQCVGLDRDLSVLEYVTKLNRAKWKPLNSGTLAVTNVNNPGSSSPPTSTTNPGSDVTGSAQLPARPVSAPVKPT